MEIIPAIDIIDGKCVRLEKGDFEKKIIYHDKPVEVAKGFEAAGIKRLHIVDLDGAKGASLKNIKTLENISKSTSLVIDFGGGLKTIEDFGASKFLPGADVLHKKIKIHGWKEETGIDIFHFIKEMVLKGINQIFCTDISKDGMMQGPATKLYIEILQEFPSLNLIASGGISCFEDLLVLKEAGCSGAIVGKAIYEGKITLKQIEGFLKNK